MSPNQIDSLSRSAGSPALPTAITTRPQLASSPAIAVLTSGELAIDSAMRRAERLRRRALDDDLDQLARALAVARDLLGEIGEHAARTPRGRPSAADRSRARSSARLRAAPVAKASSVSEVEVSPSIVTALNVSTTASETIACSAGAAIGASVKTNDSMVAMSGAIMPAPLAMPLIVTVASPSFARAVATFGKRVGGHDRLGGIEEAAGARASRASLSITPSNALRRQRLADHAGRGEEHLGGLAARGLAASFAVNAAASRPVLPVKALALPELTTSARALPPLSLARHHSTGADGHFERVKTPATVVPLSNSASSTSVRPLYLMPAAPVARRTPAISGMSGTCFGASGETV